jgi:hypothetical protein
MTYADYKAAIPLSNPVGLLVDMFRTLHRDAPARDLESAGGRMAAVYRACKPDIEIAMRVIWCTTCIEIKGSHLDYITKAVQERVSKRPRKLIGSAGVEIV